MRHDRKLDEKKRKKNTPKFGSVTVLFFHFVFLMTLKKKRRKGTERQGKNCGKLHRVENRKKKISTLKLANKRYG